MQGAMPCSHHWYFMYQTIHSVRANAHHSIIMFNKFFQSVFTNCDSYINSTACDSIHVDAMTGTASVLYKDGSVYRYTNVSRRAIAKFIMDPARSLGKFVNVVLKQPRVASTTHGSLFVA